MKKEESIQRIDEIINTMKNSIEDLEEWKKYFIDFDNNLEELGLTKSPNGEVLLNSKGEYELIGLQEMAGRREALFGRGPIFYTKVFYNKKKWSINTRNNTGYCDKTS